MVSFDLFILLLFALFLYLTDCVLNMATLTLFSVLLFINNNAGLLAFSIIASTVAFITIKYKIQNQLNQDNGIIKIPLNQNLFEPIPINKKSINKQSINVIKDDDKKQEESIINTYKASQVFYAKKKSPKPKLIIPSKSASLSSTSISSELDITHYPEYLDGYATLVNEQKKFLSAIKDDDINTIKYMSTQCDIIKNNILFGDNQVIRECTLSGSLPILKYLKNIFMEQIDLNAERGYALRWSSRKGFYHIVNWLLYQQKYQKIEINHFGFQAIKWSIDNGYPKIAKILQKYYNQNYKIKSKWDIFDLPSIYQDIINGIIDHQENEMNDKFIETIQKQYENGLDLRFHDNFAWNVAIDSINIEIILFLHKTVGINPLCNNNYLLTSSIETNNIDLLIFAKTNVISWSQWQKIDLNKFKLLCNDDPIFIKELENYHSFPDPSTLDPSSPITKQVKSEIPLSPIPWPYENRHIRKKYGILTRSKRKLLVNKGILQDM